MTSSPSANPGAAASAPAKGQAVAARPDPAACAPPMGCASGNRPALSAEDAAIVAWLREAHAKVREEVAEVEALS